MAPYRVVVVGMGKRGMHHAAAFAANPRFELAGICDIDRGRLDAAASKLGQPMANTPFASAQWGPVGDATAAIWNGAQTPEEALAAAQTAIEDAIAQMK